MKKLLGFVLMLLGLACVCAGLYVGVYHWLVGGVVTVIEQLQADKLNATITTWAIVKAIFFEIPTALGGIFGGILFMFGWAVATDTV